MNTEKEKETETAPFDPEWHPIWQPSWFEDLNEEEPEDWRDAYG